jgi:hypothetical protein
MLVRYLATALVLAAVGPAAAQSQYDTSITDNRGTSTNFSVFVNPYPNLVISCGEPGKGGSVTISTKDGHVTLDNCAPDDGARAFWRAVEMMYGSSAFAR